MTENMKIWLKRLYMEAADDHLITASNERLWSQGSDNDEEATLHMKNAEEHWEFADILKEMAEEIEED